MKKGLSEKYHDIVKENEDLKKDLEFFDAQYQKYREICENQVVLIDRLHIEIDELKKKNLENAVFESMGVIQ